MWEQANQTAIKRALIHPHTVIHFNGHAAYNAAQPARSALALFGNDLLTVADIYAHEPQLQYCQLVSLASCETAITGNQDITTEYVGLASDFLSHQIPYVLGTLWAVNSSSIALFVLHFYEELERGVPIRYAFQSSKNWLRTVIVQNLIQDYKTLIDELARPDKLLRGYEKALQAFLKTELLDLSTMEPGFCPYNHPYYWAAFTLTGHSGKYE